MKIKIYRPALILVFFISISLMANERPIQPDANQVINQLKALAKKNDPLSQDRLGERYLVGNGVPQNIDKAKYWYQKAADQGFLTAQSALGRLYSGWGGARPIDLKKAAQWYRKAADQGDEFAQYSLGAMYEKGEILPQDIEQAKLLYKKAADRYNDNAQNALERLQNAGEAQTTKIAQIETLAKAGDANAQIELAEEYLQGKNIPRDVAQSMYWYRKAANQKAAPAQYMLGEIYRWGDHLFPGINMSRDIRQAIFWYSKAAEQEHVVSQKQLGYIYEVGAGIPKDLKKALYWYQKAANNGDTLSKGVLKKLQKQ